MKKKILCTGSAGFILGNFVRKSIYEKQPYTLVSVDRVNSNSMNSLYWNKNHTFYIADIRDQHIIDIIFQFEKPDIVVHGAAETFVDYSLNDPNSFVTSNILGTQVIINSCIKNNSKLIYLSTDEVYGALSNEQEESWNEDCVLNPRNPYAATKAAAELLVKAAGISHGLKYNITRCSNNYGPRQTSEKFIPKILKNIINNEKIPIYGQGLQVRDWTHVFDNCLALMTIIDKGEDNQIYNISANQEFSNIEVVQKICNIMNKGHELISFIKDPRGNGHDFRYSVNSNKLQKLGWKPKLKFNEGITQTIQWYENNQWFLK